jgi:transglutaminase-like putative cysteine protease
MTTTAAPPRTPAPAAAPAPLPWVAALVTGVAVLLAGAPVAAVVQGSGWPGHAAAAVAVVVAAGLALHRWGASAVATGQFVAVLVLLTALFADEGVLGVLPGPDAFREFGVLIVRAGEQIDAGTAPVPATREILLLVTAAFGLLAVGVHLAAVSAAAPAAAGIPLLAVFAVPAALADDLLPWWAMAAATAGFGLLLVARSEVDARSADTAGAAVRRLPGGAALIAGAVVLSLGVGAAAGFVGTAGRFAGGAGTGTGGGSIGLSPFTALRGQLDQAAPVELFRVEGLRRASYLRALTLRDYVPEAGWQASRPAPGAPLPGPVAPGPAVPGDLADVRIENVSFRDYWLPFYGVPLEVTGLPEAQWLYDASSGTGYTARPRQEDGWQQRALLPAPSAADLRAATGTSGAGPEYLNTTGVDRRVGELAQQVVAGRATSFDRALALQDFFTGPGSPFRYSLQTAPGGGDDALVEFLTVGQVGYCEQYASAMAVMLRTVGVPARVAVGFTAGTDVGRYRSISTSDAHAWVEAWFPGIGWTTFDPTPLTDGRAITPPYVQQARDAAAGGADALPEDGLPLDAPPGPDQAPAPTSAEQLGPDTADPSGTGHAGPPVWPFALVLLVALAAGAPAALRAHDRRVRLAALGGGGPDAAAAGWSELLAESADRGVSTLPSDTVRGTARRLVRAHRLDADAQQALRLVVGAVESSWYGGRHPGAGELDGPVRAVRAGIAAGSALSARDRWLPRSVLGRMSVRRLGAARERATAALRS